MSFIIVCLGHYNHRFQNINDDIHSDKKLILFGFLILANIFICHGIYNYRYLKSQKELVTKLMEGRSAFIVNNNNILKETIEPYRDIKYSQFQHNEVIRGNLNGKILDVYSSWDIASNDEDIALKKQKDLKPINEQN